MSKCQYFFCTSISWFYIVTKVSGICFSDFQDNQDNQDNQDSFLCKSEARCEVVFWERKLAGKNLRHCFIVHRCKRQPWLERSHDAIVWLKKSPAMEFTVTYPHNTLDLQWNYQLQWTGIHQFQQNITINREMKHQWWSYQPGYLKWRNDESPGAWI